jgi:hypothetical protein
MHSSMQGQTTRGLGSHGLTLQEQRPSTRPPPHQLIQSQVEAAQASAGVVNHSKFAVLVDVNEPCPRLGARLGLTPMGFACP